MPHQNNPNYTVTVEHNGKKHSADYTVASGVVVVTYGMATNQAVIGGGRASFEARRLLLEILQANRWQF